MNVVQKSTNRQYLPAVSPKKYFTARLDEKHLKKLKQIAVEEYRTPSAVLRMALSDFLSQYPKEEE